MIVLLGKSEEKNTELQKLAAYMGLSCVCVDLFEKTSPCAYTPWMYYAHRTPENKNKPLFWLDLETPSYWSFQAGDIRIGQIVNIDELLGRVYFREPYEDQCVDRIEWIKNNEVYCIDYYDGSGIKYAEAVLNDGSESIMKYCDLNGTPMVTVWTSTGFVSVKKESREEIYTDEEQFCAAFMKDFISDHEDDTIFFAEPALRKYLPEGSRCVLYLPDQVPGELADQNFRDALSLIVAGRPGISDSVRQLCGGGQPPEILEVGSIIDRSLGHSVHDALIVTRSQHIENLKVLVEGLPELHFHIAAGTMMAPGLMEFDKYDNVSLYPNSPRNRIIGLMENSAFYLDINHYLEYEGMVHTAMDMDRLVYAFDSTVHQRASLPQEHIYAKEDTSGMIADIRRAMSDPEYLQESLEVQRKHIGITESQRGELEEYLLNALM